MQAYILRDYPHHHAFLLGKEHQGLAAEGSVIHPFRQPTHIAGN